MNAFEQLRPRFPRLEEVVCMATHTFAPLLVETFDDLEAYARTLRERPRPSADWFARLEEMYTLFERLLGGTPGSVALCASSTASHAAILAAIEPTRERHTLLLSDLQFPSMEYLCSAQVRRGFTIERVPSDGTHLDAAAIAERIDHRVAAVLAPIVAPFNGARLDPRPVVDAAVEAGAVAVFDAHAAVGIVELDARELPPCVLIGGTSKWLSGGGTGLAFMYVHPDLVEVLPAAYPGWLAADRFMDFAPQFRPAAGARRYQQGTPALEPIYTARAGLRFVLEQGVPALAVRNAELLERLFVRAEAQGLILRTPSERDRRAGVIALEVERAPEVAADLQGRCIEVDVRRDVVRLGPHWCVTAEECDRAVDAVADAVYGWPA
jgi:kynureninase